MRLRFLVLALFVGILASAMPTMAASYSGMITATRDASRSIVSAVLETANRDGAGNPVTYNIVMDENGRAIAEQYENKDVKIDGILKGKDITVDTWEGLNQPAAASSEPEPSYNDDDTSGGPDEAVDPTGEEPSEGDEPKDDEPKDDEPKDDEPKDDEPKDEEPKDDEPSDDEPKDEEPKDEEPKDEDSSSED